MILNKGFIRVGGVTCEVGWLVGWSGDLESVKMTPDGLSSCERERCWLVSPSLWIFFDKAGNKK